jgi:hypothetical protein
MESPSGSAEHGHGDAASRDVARYPADGRVVGRCSTSSVGSCVGLPGGDGRGAVGGPRSASAVPLPVVGAAGASGVVVAPEVAAVIVAGWAAGAGLSELTGRWRMTPGEVRAVLRGVRVAPVVAEPVVASGPVGGMLVRAIRAAQGSRGGVVVGAERLAGPASLLLRAGAGPAVHAPPGRRLGVEEAPGVGWVVWVGGAAAVRPPGRCRTADGGAGA